MNKEVINNGYVSKKKVRAEKKNNYSQRKYSLVRISW